jgi:hypothetical protein
MSGVHPLGNWSTNPKGYPKFHSGPYRKQFVHRVVFALVAGRPVREGFHVHHMGDKLDYRPHMLLECPPEFNMARDRRHPYTGRFLSIEGYYRVVHEIN